jgi:hypothetical protein
MPSANSPADKVVGWPNLLRASPANPVGAFNAEMDDVGIRLPGLKSIFGRSAYHVLIALLIPDIERDNAQSHARPRS